jgi:hypothetical protein
LETCHNRAIKKPVIDLIADDSDGPGVQPSQRRSPKPRTSNRRKKIAEDVEEIRLDEDISRLLNSHNASAATSSTPSASLPHDSIMDDSEEEEEVNETLLVEDE